MVPFKVANCNMLIRQSSSFVRLKFIARLLSFNILFVDISSQIGKGYLKHVVNIDNLIKGILILIDNIYYKSNIN